ncbi:unnamed protein product [Symbiodinium sp. CCMP2592]|nr:unnamed protein product [Symbiodinium sp. CCMP2592]
MKVLFRLIPTVPLMSDWSKLGPCLDFFLGCDFNGLLERLLDAAQWAQQVSQCEPAPDRDPALDDKVNWHALAGRRFARFKQMMSSAQERFERVLLAITTEPLRHIHDTYLKFAHTACDSQAWPKLLSELWPRTSKNHAVMQYYATCLQGKASRLRLLVNLSGDSDLQAWIRDNQQEALSARSKILMNATELQQRFAGNLDRQPWQLFALADCRRIEDHPEICKRFFATPSCCLPAGFARELREMLSEQDFLGDLLSWRWMFLLSSLIIKLSTPGLIAAVEQRHARHKRPDIRPVQLNAWKTNANDGLVTARKRARSLSDATQGRTSRPKAWSVFELFRFDWIKGQRASGKPFNPASKESWDACKAAFEALSPARLDELKNRKWASELTAARQRLQQKTSQAPSDLQIVAAQAPPQEDQSREDGWKAMMKRLGQADGAPDTTQPPFPKHVTCQSFKAPLVDQASGRAINSPSQVAQMESLPLRPEDLRERWFSRKVILSHEISGFCKRATRFVSEAEMPDRVEYPACCGELCRNQNTRRSVLFHDRLVELLKTAVQSGCARTKGWAKHVPAANICLAAECYVDRDPAGPNLPAHPLRWLSEDALAARLCFVDDKPVGHVRLTLLKWTLDDAAPRLDRHRIVELGAAFDAQSENEPAQQCRRAPRDRSDDFDLLDDIRAPVRRRRRPFVAIEDRPQTAGSDAESEPVRDADAEPVLQGLENIGDEDALHEGGVAEVVPDEAGAEAGDGLRPGDAVVGVSEGPVPVPSEPSATEVAGARACEIQDVGCWNFRRKSDNAEVGRLHQIGVDTLKATCKLHRSCVCMISYPPAGSERLRAVSVRLQRAPTLHDIEVDLVKWFDAGLTATAAQHQEASLNLRSGNWAVRVRRPKAAA